MASLEIIQNLEMIETKGGNTITPLQSKVKSQMNQCMHWCFTWNNYVKEDIETLETLFKYISHKYCFQEETGANNTPHLQGVVSLKKRMRWSEFGLPKEIHWEKTAKLTESYLYCCKPETRTGDTFTFNYNLPYTVNIPILYEWQKKIVAILKEKPNDRKIYWYWEENGCAGKTTLQKYIFTNFDQCVVLSGKGADMKNGIVEYKKKRGDLPKIILINIPRSIDKEFVSYTGLEEVKDMFFYSGKYEGGMICGENPHLMIFANEMPLASKMSEDRWEIHNINDL